MPFQWHVLIRYARHIQNCCFVCFSGPIGSPVISRQKKEQDLSLQQQNSNTWPFLNEVALQDECVTDKGTCQHLSFLFHVFYDMDIIYLFLLITFLFV